MHSEEISQQPQIILPAAITKLDVAKLQMAPLCPLGDVTMKQFRKTASAIAEQPWNMMAGQRYLEALCDNNEAKHLILIDPPQILSYLMKDVPMTCPQRMRHHQEQRDVRVVMVAGRKGNKRRKGMPVDTGMHLLYSLSLSGSGSL